MHGTTLVNSTLLSGVIGLDKKLYFSECPIFLKAVCATQDYFKENRNSLTQYTLTSQVAFCKLRSKCWRSFLIICEAQTLQIEDFM